jgi:hypothetical protein
MRTPLVVALAAGLAVSDALAPLPAQADDSAVIEQFFSDGRQLMAAGRFAEACPKFLASYDLQHRVGTLLALANCYEQNRQIASAWARFVEARTLATRNNQAERAEYATQHAAMLESRRSMLTIVADPGVEGLVVRRDGTVVAPAVYGEAVPIDGGTHRIDVSARGKTPVSASIAIGPEGEQKTYTVPHLVDAPVVAAAAAPVAPPPNGRHVSPRVVAGIAVAGTGVVLAGVGAYFGAAALVSKNDSAPYCGSDGQKDDCFGAGVGFRSTAVSEATASSVLLGVGAAMAIGGVVLWWTAPAWQSKATVGFDGRTLRLGGVF